jgi:hypothetical protein
MNEPMLISSFDKATWDEHGISWARSVKTLSLAGVAVDYGIPQQGKDKLKEMGIDVVPGITHQLPVLGKYESILRLPEGIWLYCPPDYKLTPDVRGLFSLADKKMACRTKEQQTFFMVFPIGSNEDRVKYSTVIEDRIAKKHGNPLSAEVLCGPSLQWKLFVGFFRYCLECGFVDPRGAGLENLVINLFSVTFEDVFEVV